MTVFEEACLLSCEQWVDSFPSEIPKHKFSRKHKNKMNELLQEKQNTDNFKLSKKVIKVILIAAILLSLVTTVFAIPSSREYIIKKLLNHSTYNVIDDSDYIDIDYLTVNYVPDDFEKTDEFISKDLYSYSYKNNTHYFSVDKYAINTQLTFDTEEYDHENILIDGKKGIFYKTNQSESGVIFNNGNYIFIVNGNISKEELIKIAQELE